MRRLALTLVMLAGGLGCQTTIQFENGVENASLDDVRWVSDETGNSYRAEPDQWMEPGESSDQIIVRPEDRDQPGTVHFDLVIEGKRVALVTRKTYTAHQFENTVFEITADTVVKNPLLPDDSED
jgi:hypothetical protein